MSTTLTPQTGAAVRALHTCTAGDVIEFDAYDRSGSGGGRKEFQKQVTNVRRFNSSVTYLHVVDLDTGERSVIGPRTKRDSDGVLRRTGSLVELEASGDEAGRNERSVLNPRVLGR